MEVPVCVLLVVALLAAAIQAQNPPCFGDIGQVARFTDVGTLSDGTPFSTFHQSYWNYTKPTFHMRYEVINTNLTTGEVASQFHLFRYSEGMAYQWNGGTQTDCVSFNASTPHPECVPSNYVVQGSILVGAQPSVIWGAPNSNASVMLVSKEGEAPVALISRNAAGAVIESILFTGYSQSIDDSSVFEVPSFCVDAPFSHDYVAPRFNIWGF